jgi:sugar/nucleoside kinase (ribokinase family)
MDNNQFELILLGDASVDLFITPTESESLCQMDDKESFICFNYGDKIPVKNLDFCLGGNAVNTAVGVARLGIKNAVVLTLGDDLIGKQIIEGLKKENIDLTYVIQQPATSSNFSTIVNYSGERTIFTYHAPRSYEFPVTLPSTPWAYLTSMGETFKPFYNHVVEWLKKNSNIKLVFNPGTWQMRQGVEGIREVLALTHLIFLNREEAEKLTEFGLSKGKEKELLAALTKLGPKICVITDGPNGSYIYDGERYLYCGILPTSVYERTGAGDAFSAGFITAIIKGRPFEEALLWGTVNSTSVIGFTGATKGLLKETEISVWLEKAKTAGVVVKEF